MTAVVDPIELMAAAFAAGTVGGVAVFAVLAFVFGVRDLGDGDD
jgi:hypothetical protein